MAEHKKVPSIRFKGFTDDWERRKLGDISDSYSGGTPTAGKAEYYGGSIPFIRSAEVNSDTTELFLTDKGLKNSSAKMVKKGDILYALYGATSGEVGLSRLDGAINQAILDIKPHEDYDAPFLMQWLRKSKESIIGTYLQGGQGNLSGTIVTSLIVDCPNYDEQNQIGEFFANIDNLIALYHCKHEKLLNVKRAMLDKMFPKEGEKVPKIRFKGFSDDWEQHKLGDMIEYIVDNRGKNPRYYCTEGIPVIDNYMIKNTLYPEINTANRFIDEGLFESFIRKYNEKDDVLITLVGNGIGNVTLFPDDKAVIIQNTLGLRAKDDKRFLLFLLMAYNKKLLALDRGMAQPSIRQDELLDLDIYVPDGEEQTKIGMYFVNLDNLSTLHQRKIEKLKNMKTAMLEKMFV